MSLSPIDVVSVNAFGVPGRQGTLDFSFDEWTSFSIRNSIVEPAEASFELGDESGWQRVSELCELGARFVVLVNDRPRMTGRVEALSTASDARQSTVQSFCLRTKLSDAAYSSAPQGLRLKGASIKDFVLACYASIGLTEADFHFTTDVSRDLMTGRTTRGGKPPIDLEPLTEEQAKVQPPESTFTAVDRHLRRHGMLHWDGPDGRIVVGSPDDTQEPITSLWSVRGALAQHNNVLSIERRQDVSGSPTVLGVFGVGGARDFSRTKITSLLYNQDLIARGFRRQVVIVDEAVRTKALAGKRAQREFALRNRELDRLIATVDGLAFRDGGEPAPWSPDTTVDVVAAPLGGALGAYYCESVDLSRNATQGDISRLSLVRQGVWVL